MENFKLSGADAAFTSRSNDLFTAIDALGSKHEAYEKNRQKQSKDKDQLIKPDPVKEDFHTVEKSFKKASSKPKAKQGPSKHSTYTPRSRNFVPDYKQNPSAWTKYDLSDVSSEDMSEKSNKSAAFSFLNDLKARKANDQSITDMEKANLDTKCVFKKPKIEKVQNLNEEETKDTFTGSLTCGSKITVPEYVVGSKPIKQKKTKARSIRAEGGIIGLDHLCDLDCDTAEDNSEEREGQGSSSKNCKGRKRAFRSRSDNPDDSDD